ncbi:hypothetical protein [Mycoplasmopsis cynos]|uniref:hypothetical protein n=1 Tax=Mycoplasmopsis cynos TaxID=171284 RepID=UPI0024C6E67D|nr:hypothetical protein [Mycoplasmopsis cynos]WAM07741.1 hypothetical protein ONA21_06560 [Mycoplasmopsis cynos]
MHYLIQIQIQTKYQTAKNTLKSEIEKLSTKTQSNDEYAKLNNLISKIKELKNKALSIVNANEKIEVEKLINGLDNENKVANIELAILKAKIRKRYYWYYR